MALALVLALVLALALALALAPALALGGQREGAGLAYGAVEGSTSSCGGTYRNISQQSLGGARFMLIACEGGPHRASCMRPSPLPHWHHVPDTTSAALRAVLSMVV